MKVLGLNVKEKKEAEKIIPKPKVKFEKPEGVRPTIPSSVKESDIRIYPFYIANKPLYPNSKLEVVNKYTGKVFARCALAAHKDIDSAIGAAERALPAVAAMASFERKEVLEKVVAEVTSRAEEFAVALCLEAGKPIRFIPQSYDYSQ